MAGPQETGCCTSNCLVVATIVTGSIGFLLWGCAIGFSLGYCFYTSLTAIGALVVIPVNAGYIYCSSQLIFSLTEPTFPSEKTLADVRKNTGRLVALTLIGFSEFVTAVVWFCMYYDPYDSINTLFGVSFSFVWTSIVVGLAGDIPRQSWRNIQANVEAPRSLPPGYHPVGPSPGPPPVAARQNLYDNGRYSVADPTKTSGVPVHGRVAPWANQIY